MTKAANEILAYLVEHPRSRDTIEGIMEWWLLEQKIKFRKKRVEKALSELVDKELILKHQGRDSLIHYRINNQKSKEIQEFLNQKSA